jgi:misacylated tRNA(Ala) deacylase
MAELLYYQDPYIREFSATVTAVEGNIVALDRSAFYPGGGGQPHDVGVLTAGGLAWPVARVRKAAGAAGEELWHELAVDDPPPVGTELQGGIDWERRYGLMRIHTALHILCGVVWRDYGAQVTGGNMEPLRGRLDFEFESMRQELVREIEEKINREVAAARPVFARVMPRAEAFAIPDLIRTKINLLPDSLTEVRTIEIAGLDLQADGGTHVANSREVGAVRVGDYKSKGRINKRIELVLEPAAVPAAPGPEAMP